MFATKPKIHRRWAVLCAGVGLWGASRAGADELIPEYRGGRHLAEGDTGVTTAEGVDAVFYNPALTAEGKGILEEVSLVSPQVTVGTDTRQIYTEMAQKESLANMVTNHKGKPQHAGLQNYTGLVFRRASLGVMASGQLDARVGTNPSTGIPEVWARGVTRAGVYMSFARSLGGDSFHLGTTFKFVQKSEAKVAMDLLTAEQKMQDKSLEDSLKSELKRGNGVGADVGMAWKMDGPSTPRLGLVARNLGMKYRWPIPSTGTAPEAEPVTIDAGFSIEPGTKKSHARFSLDVKDVLNAQKESIYKRLNMGCTLSFVDVIGFSAGLHQGYPTYGGWVDVKFVRVEGGIWSEELGSWPGEERSQRYFARLSLGWSQ